MTLPNVNTTLEDDTFFVDLNGEDTSDCVAAFVDFGAHLLKSVGTTAERQNGVMRIDNLEDWNSRLASENVTGVDILPENLPATIQDIFKQPFLGIDKSSGGSFIYEKDLKDAIYLYNNYIDEEQASNFLGLPAGRQMSSGTQGVVNSDIPRQGKITIKNQADVDLQSTTQKTAIDFNGETVIIPDDVDTSASMDNAMNRFRNPLWSPLFDPYNAFSKIFEGFANLADQSSQVGRTLRTGRSTITDDVDVFINDGGYTGPGGNTGNVLPGRSGFRRDDGLPDSSTNNNSLFLGLTYGNTRANQGHKRFKYGPISPWTKLWFSIENYLKYGGNVIVFSNYENENPIGDAEVLQKMLLKKYTFDLLVSLSKTENDLMRIIANNRQDCIAVTYVDRTITEEEPPGLTTDVPNTGPKPFLENLGGLFKLRSIPDSELFVSGGTSGITSGFQQSFGSSSEFVSWLNDNYLHDYTYPSRVSSWNPDTGGISYSSYGLSAGNIHIAKFYEDWTKFYNVVPPTAFDYTVFNDDDRFALGPGINGSHSTHPQWLSQEFREQIEFLYFIPASIPLPYTLQGITMRNSSVNVGELVYKYPIYGINWDNAVSPGGPFFTPRQLFYPATNLKYFGVSGSTMESSFKSNINGITECAYKYQKLFDIDLAASTDASDDVAYNIQSGFSESSVTSEDGFIVPVNPVDNYNTSGPYNTVSILNTNKNFTNPNTPFEPSFSPFIDVTKTFAKAKEQYITNGYSAHNSSVDNLRFLPSDGNNMATSDFPQFAMDKMLDGPNNGIINIGIPDYINYASANLFQRFESDLFSSLWGCPSNNIDSGYGWPGGTPSPYYVGNTGDKITIIKEYSENNFLDYHDRVVSLLNTANIYAGPTLGQSPGEPGWWMTATGNENKYWGCTCSQLPEFFQEYFFMGSTKLLGLGIGYPPVPGDNRGFVDIDCIEFGPNGTTTDVLAAGSTYQAYIGFRNRHPKLFIHHTDLEGSAVGATSSEYPNTAPRSLQGGGQIVDVDGVSWLPDGSTTDVHPGFVRGGTLSNLYLPFLMQPASRVFDDITPGGIHYGRSQSNNIFGWDFPSSVSLQLKSKYDPDA